MGLLIVVLIATVIVVIGLSASKADWGGFHVNWLDGWTRLLCRYLHQLKPLQVTLPDNGPALVVSNHVSGLDPFLLIASCQRPLRFLIATEQYNRPIFHWLFRAAGCIPVDRKGRPELALRAARRALDKGEVIAIFPHGKIHLDTDPPRRLKAGFIRLAAWTSAPVYPVRIDGVCAQGKIMTAPFCPSKVKLTLTDPMQIDETTSVRALEQIAVAIETPGAY
jgi:1-acyl-sn-glycerol-3-phosphate acyltransferase